MKPAFLLAVPLFCSAVAFAQTMSASDAFTAGKSAGDKSHTQTILNNVNSTQGSQTLSGYTTAPPSQSSYWGGNGTVLGTLYTGGSGKIAECGTGTSSTNTADQQHCQAVNSIMNTSANRPSNLITNSDPLIQTGKVITAKPDDIAGSVDGAYTNCTTTTKQNDPSFVMQTCEDWSETTKEACVMGQEVKVNPDYLYRCRETLSTINSSTCTYGRVVKVDADYNYQCVSNVQKTITQTCSNLAVLSVTSSSTWGGTGQQLINKVIYNSVGAFYARIYANVAPNTYKVCYYGSNSGGTAPLVCNNSVTNGKYITLVSNKYYAAWGTLSCTAQGACQWAGSSNNGCYQVPGCQGGTGSFNVKFTAPTTTIQTKEISWQNNCTQLEAASK